MEYRNNKDLKEITPKEKNLKISEVKESKGWKYQELKFNLEV